MPVTPMVVDWDVIEGAGVRNTIKGLDIIRVCLVRNVPGDCTNGQSPSVLLTALTAPGMPTLYSPHPDPAYQNALLEEQNPRSIGSSDCVMVELVYRMRPIDPVGHANANAWTVTDSYQTSHIITYPTALETLGNVWYKAGATKSGGGGNALRNSPPAQAAIKTGGVPKIITYRVIKATAILLATDWNTWKPTVRAAKGKINSDTWGTSPRGHWFFLGPNVKYFDKIQRKNVEIELTFLEDEKGHYPLIAYLNTHGIHPADCITEDQLRILPGFVTNDGTPFKEGAVAQGNGLSMASIYKETPFATVFAFTPDQD